MSITVTFTVGSPYGAGGTKLRCLVFTSAASSPVGGTGNGFGDSGQTGYECAVTAAATGSYIAGSISGNPTTDTYAALSGSTILDAIYDSTNSVVHGSFISSSTTSSTGSASYGSSTAFSTNGGAVAAEIKASGTLTRDSADEPAVVTSATANTVTTASFTPPGGSIVVALCDGLGSSGSVTDSSSMTWTAAVQDGSDGYAGVFWAQVPASGTTVDLTAAQVTVTAPAPGAAAGPVALPAAQVTADAPAPAAVVTAPLTAARVTAAAPAPGLAAGPLALPAAAVTVSAPAPAAAVTVPLPAAAVTVTAPAPAPPAAVIALPAAAVTVTAPAPAIGSPVTVALPAARVTVTAPAPSVTLPVTATGSASLAGRMSASGTAAAIAVTLVQHASAAAQYTSGTAGTLTVTLPAAITAGNCAVAVISLASASGGDRVTAVTTGGSADNWALAVIPAGGQAASYPCTLIAVDDGAAVSGKTVEVAVTFGSALTTSASCMVLADVYEFSGVVSTSAVDRSLAAAGKDNGGAVSWNSGTTAATTQADEAWVGGAFEISYVADTTQTVTGTSGWHNETAVSSSLQSGGTATADRYYGYQVSGYKTVSATGTAEYTGNNASGDDGGISAAVVTLKAVPAPVGASGSASMGTLGAGGSATVAPAVTSSGSASLAGMSAAGAGGPAVPVTATGSASLASLAVRGTAGNIILDEAGHAIEDETGSPILDETGPATPVTATGSVSLASVSATGGLPGGKPIEDEAGSPLLDETGADILDEAGGAPLITASGSLSLTAISAAGTVYTGGPTVNPPWQAARAGLPGDPGAIAHAARIAQSLVTHGITPVYQGTRQWSAAGYPGGDFFWLTDRYAGWLPAWDVSQPFTLPAGVTSVGRVQAAVLPAGTGASLEVLLCPDDGGVPDLSAPLARAAVPASHVTALAAPQGLAQGGPLASARCNTLQAGPSAALPWATPAVTASGAGSYPTPVTSGQWTLLIGGTSGASAIPAVNLVSYAGTGSVLPAAPPPALPQAVTAACACATADTVLVAGGYGAAYYGTVWAASWDAASGTAGSWSAQAALPRPAVNAGMAASTALGTVYVTGGAPGGGGAAAGTGTVWWAPASGGQVSQWNAGPSLPQPVNSPFTAVIGNWLVVCGGQDTAGNALSATWYSALGADGSPGPWQAGPPMAQACYPVIPGWNMAAAGTALVIISGATGSLSWSPLLQVLSVGTDGPAPEWEYQWWDGSGAGSFPAAAYPGAAPGSWDVVLYRLGSVDWGTLLPVPIVSVPLPAGGLVPGDTYHLVFRQQAGDRDNDTLIAGWLASNGTYLTSARGSGGPWQAGDGTIAAAIYDQTAGSGLPLHFYEDAGARLTTFATTAPGQLTGILEATAFPAGSPEAVLPAVTQVTWTSNGLPYGTVQIA